MSIFTRVNRAINAFRYAPNMDAVKQTLDKIKHEGDAEKVLSSVVKQQEISKSPSKLAVRSTTNDATTMYAYSYLRTWVGDHHHGCPAYGSGDRDEYLDKIWMDEPILAGAVYSMTAKMTALKWMVTGRRLPARQAATIFANAEYLDGHEWGGFISSVAQDFYVTDRGPYIETARGETGYGGDITRLAGNLAAIGHIDALNCWQTGNREIPMVYYSDMTGQILRMKPGDYIHFTSMPKPRERYLGIGYSAVSRALRAALLLMGLHDYDTEKLNNLPPEGVAAVTGLTADELKDAFTLWKAAREHDHNLTYPQVLWLIGSQPNSSVTIDFTPFSQIPESFDRKSVVDHYVATLALDFGVDIREFWTISSGGGLGTAGESEIQHMKAKGKGPGEFISIMERHLNAELPEDTSFGFDTQDIEEDQMAAMVAKSWIDALFPLFTGIPNPNLAPPAPFGGSGLPSTPGNKAGQQANNPAGPRPPVVQTKPAMLRGKEDPTTEPKKDTTSQTLQVIDKDQFLRLLIDHGVLPEWLANDQRTMVSDTDIHIAKEGHPDDFTKITWDHGILKEERLPAIVLNSHQQPIGNTWYADYIGVDKGAPEGDKTVYAVQTDDGIVTSEDFSTIWQELKQNESNILEMARDIKGEPIPESESKRGVRVTARALHNELERWRNHPILSKYALTVEEEAALLEKKQ